MYLNNLQILLVGTFGRLSKSSILPLILSMGLVGCSTPTKMTHMLSNSTLFYQPTIVQGDMITREQLRQLKTGMTRYQVRALLGSPVLQDSFHADRWDYVYTEGPGSQPTTKRYLVVYFDDDHLTRIEGTMGTSETPQTDTPKPQIIPVPDWSD